MPKIDLKNVSDFFDNDELLKKSSVAEKALGTLIDKSGVGAEFTGFVTLPDDYDRDELERIKSVAKKIRSNSEIFIVIGIGGSYLGSRAVIELVNSPLGNRLGINGPEIYFAGCNFSSDYAYELSEICKEKDFSIDVISKSGTTTETMVAFRFFKKLLIEKYGENGARERIFCTTDKEKGTLKSLADENGWETFVIPGNVGGRFSVLTSVGLLPIAVAGIDVDALLSGAASGACEYLSRDYEKNPALQYAAVRNLLFEKGKTLELLVGYEPAFAMMAEWWKQLYGESEGKNGKGIFPCSAIFSTDLHSIGQFIQEGSRIFFETTVCFEKAKHSFVVDFDEKDSDGLNFLAGMDMNDINEKARLGTLAAHIEADVPNIVITVPERSAFEVGKLIYFFEIAVSVSGYMLGMNPFDQPGVESYKKKMFALLGNPSYENI